jgi:hypothetical protein
MPQFTFRTPSGSALDRGTNDPVADVTTPLLKFVWRKEGKLTNNMVCFLTGKSTDTNIKKKGGKEPDILIAILHNYRDLTLYESNFHRIDMEDYKGLEVVLLLSASVIRDVYCGQKKNAFNVGDPNAGRKNSGGINILGRKKSTPLLNNNDNASTAKLNSTPPAQNTNRPPGGFPQAPSRPGPLQSNGLPMNSANAGHGRSNSQPNVHGVPPPDPREQWQIDAESTRLRKQQDAEHRAAQARIREKEKADAAEAKRIRKMIEVEDKERRRREAEVEKETERLRKQYGDQSNLLTPRLPGRPRPQSQMYANPGASATTTSILKPPRSSHGGGFSGASFLHPSGPYGGPAASQSSFFHGPSSAPLQQPSYGQQQHTAKPKKSFLGLRRASDAAEPESQTLKKKKSSFW